MLNKIFQVFKLVLEKVEEPEITLPTSFGSLNKQESSRKTSTSTFFDYIKAFEYVDHNKRGKNLKKIGIPDYLPCLLRNLYSGREATVITGHGTRDCFQIRKGFYQSCISSPCLFNSYCEIIRFCSAFLKKVLYINILEESS